jgi:hypothetical protein
VTHPGGESGNRTGGKPDALTIIVCSPAKCPAILQCGQGMKSTCGNCHGVVTAEPSKNSSLVEECDSIEAYVPSPLHNPTAWHLCNHEMGHKLHYYYGTKVNVSHGTYGYCADCVDVYLLCESPYGQAYSQSKVPEASIENV